MRPLPLVVAALGALPLLCVLVEWAAPFELGVVRFEQPALSVVTAALVAAIAVRLRRLPARLGNARRTAVEALVGGAALFLSFAALGLEIGLALDRLVVIVAVDRSRSIDLVPGASSRIAAELLAAETSMRADDRIGRVVFGATTAIEDPPRTRSALPNPQRAEIGRDATDLGAAIRQALAAVPPDSAARVVLLSDGVATRGDAMAAALSATALDVPIDVVPLEQGTIANVRVTSLRVTPRAARGEALDLKLVTESANEASVEVRVYRDGELVRRGPTRIRQGQDVIALREIAEEPGLHRYDVEVSALDPAHDRAPEDNLGVAFVRVRGPSTALVISDEDAAAQPIERALRDAAFEVERAGPSAIPADLSGFARHDLLVLGSLAASELSPTQLDAIRSYVRELGGGLLLLGGERAMGPGGYARTAIEELSPLSFDLKQERRRASLAELIAIDYSGSMAARAGDRTKLELANEAAVRSADLLGAGDRLGVFHVDTRVQVTVPLGPLGDKVELARRIRAVATGGGGIHVDVTLDAAYRALGRETTQLKHLLLFADGSDAEERARAPLLVGRAKERGITTSVVALGNGADVPALERLATLGGGRFYLVEDATRLPAVFAQETVIASRSAINETVFVPSLGLSGPALRGVDFAAAPPLTGYVVGIPKGRASIHLSGPENDPILATWSVGIGRAAAFTSDFGDRWGRAWTSWDGAARLFGQLGRDLARRGDDPRIQLEADAAGGELSVRVSALDLAGRSDSFRRLRVKVGGPDGFARDVALEPTGAGSFAAKLPLSRPGPYLATVIDETTGEPLATTGAALPVGEELRPTGTDRALLARLAQVSGGKTRTTLAGIFADRELERRAYRDLTPYWLVLGALALVGAVAARRLSLSWPAFLRRRPRPTSLPQPSPAPVLGGSLEALRVVRRRHERPVSEAPPAPVAGAPARAAEPSSRGSAPPARSAAPSTRRAAPPPTKSAAEILLERRRRRERG